MQMIRGLDDFFLNRGSRPGHAACFCRIAAYSAAVDGFVRRYYALARTAGTAVEGRIPSPGGDCLSRYEEAVGAEFRLERGFIRSALGAWLPDAGAAPELAAALYDALGSLRSAGKDGGVLRNTFIKFLCWLRSPFGRVARRLGDDDAPKALFEGDVTRHELLFLWALSRAGCDVVLLEYGGDAAYRSVDPGSVLSSAYQAEGLGAFPPGFCLRALREEEDVCGGPPAVRPCTNTWMAGVRALDAVRTPPAARGRDASRFYNCFCRVRGAEDAQAYAGMLYRLYRELKGGCRRVAVAEGAIPPPAPDEADAVVRHGGWRDAAALVRDLAPNISFPGNPELRKLAARAFSGVLREDAAAGTDVGRLASRAVFLICWLRRYAPALFAGWRPPEVGCFFHLGGCRNASEALFLRFLSRLPVDVVVLVPDADGPCRLEDAALVEERYPRSLALERFPREAPDVREGTAAYRAERELDDLLYQGSGMYRNQQYARAGAVTLRTTYEEIALLWREDIPYRPGFCVADGAVDVPVIFAKVCGVKDGNAGAYWGAVRSLASTGDVLAVTHAPFIPPSAPNPMKPCAAGFFKGGRLLRDKIRSHPGYPYGSLREEAQEHILDKLQLLIDRKVIRGTGESGAEYTVAATVLNLPREVARMIQKFDFTKAAPKLLYVAAGEEAPSEEDAILAAFLNLAGFDVVFFVPTGYQSVERYYARGTMDEHQIGGYVYDMRVPDVKAAPLKALRDTLFRRR